MMKTDDYNDQSVTEEKLKDGAITTRKIADGSVTKDKLDSSIHQEINDSVTASNEATEKAKEATAKADQATENAKQATVAATAAKEAADTATQLATNATTASVQATEQAKAATTKAEEATVKANEAAQKADDSREQTEQTLGTMQEVVDKVAIKDEEGALVETPFRYIQNEEFIFAKVDAEDKLLFGIQFNGTPVFGKTSAVEDRLQSQVTLLAERVATIMGDEDTTNVIDTMNELKKFFAEIENTQTLTSILANLDNIAKKLDKTTIKDEEGNVQDTPFRVIENEKFIMAVVDSDDKVLFGIYRATGKPYYPLNDMYHISQSEEFLWVILDAANHPLLGILQDGTSWAAKAQWLDDIKAIKKALSSIDETLKTFQTKEDGKGLINLDVADSFFYISNDEYIIAVVDAENKVLGGFRADDGHMIVGGIDIADAIIDIADIKERTAHLSTIENDEYLSIKTDAEGKVIGYTAPDGTRYEHRFNAKNLSVTNLNLEENGNCASEIKNALEKIGFTAQTPMDWSKNDYLQIPEPLCAKLNLITDKMPTAKSGMGISGVNCDIPCIAQFWDMQGNYFRIPALISAQGSSSMAFPKKNIAIDLFNDENRKNNFSIKFGDWVAQDSFHLKAYYTDFFRGVGAVGYQIFNEIAKSKGIGKERPYMSYTSKYGTGDIGVDTIDDLKLNVDTGAKCFPMGFPVIIYQNGVFYGVYSWQLKKHRDNMHMDKKTAEHIHLDGVLDGNTIFGGKVDWTQFEVRNPKKLYMQEKHIIKGEETLEYNGDYPFEIMGEDSAFYDSSNKDMKRCAQVKKYILNLSNRISELSTAVSAGTSEEDIKKLFDKYFNASFIVDYFLEINLVGNGDGTTKNWQWTTYDGIKWVCNPYDLDAAFGSYHLGNIAFSNDTNYGTWRGTSLTIPTGWIFKYYKKELKLQWENLKKIGIFNAEHITSLVKTWSDRIGIDNWVKEYSKWNESPCNRASLINSKYWDFSRTQVSTVWSEKGTYTKDTDVLYKGKVYRSLVNNNKGNEPAENNVYWKDLTYNNDIEYTQGDICYYGKTTFYSFTCKLNCIGQPPFTGFYSQYPYEAGHFDSIYRVFNFVTNSIAHIDKNIQIF